MTETIEVMALVLPASDAYSCSHCGVVFVTDDPVCVVHHAVRLHGEWRRLVVGAYHEQCTPHARRAAPAPDADPLHTPPRDLDEERTGVCAEHGAQPHRWIEGAWRCYECGEPAVAMYTPDADGAAGVEGDIITEDIALALSDLQRASQAAGECGYGPSRARFDREEREAREEVEREITKRVRAQARAAEVDANTLRRAGWTLIERNAYGERIWRPPVNEAMGKLWRENADLRARLAEAERERDKWRTQAAGAELVNDEIFRVLAPPVEEERHGGGPLHCARLVVAKLAEAEGREEALRLAYESERTTRYEAEGRAAAAGKALEDAAGVFDSYADLHDGKGTPEGVRKAEANRAHAAYCRAAAARAGGEGRDDA